MDFKEYEERYLELGYKQRAKHQYTDQVISTFFETRKLPISSYLFVKFKADYIFDVMWGFIDGYKIQKLDLETGEYIDNLSIKPSWGEIFKKGAEGKEMFRIRPNQVEDYLREILE